MMFWSFFGYVLAISFSAAAYFYYRKWSSLQKNFNNTLGKVRLMKKEYSRLDDELRSKIKVIASMEDRISSHSKKENNLFEKINELSDELSEKDAKLKKLSALDESAFENMKLQLKAYEIQVQEIQDEKNTLKREASETEKVVAKKYETQISKLKSNIESLKAEKQETSKSLREAEKLVSKYEKKIESRKLASPEEIIKYQKRAHRANYFYQTMKGRKQMAEERARNWEVALELLATWILKEKNVEDIPQRIGPLVGEALSTINREAALGEMALDSDAEDELASVLAKTSQSPSETVLND